MDKYSVMNIHWTCKDIISKNGEIIDIIESSNIVVKDCSRLIAGLIGGKIAKGIAYWAVGRGSTAWDTLWGITDPTPSDTDVLLVNEIGRKIISSANITYVDVNGADTATITNRIKIQVVFTETDANGDWREFGLFGGDLATATLNSGIMIDHKLHKMIPKTTELTITRSIILEF